MSEIVISKSRRTAGWIVGGLPAFFVLTSGLNGMFIRSPDMVESFAKFGIPADVVTPIGLLAFVSAALYFIPRTAVLGAILLTGYLGGAVMTHLRVHDPVLPAPVVVGVLLWLGLYLRDPRVAALIPLRKG